MSPLHSEIFQAMLDHLEHFYSKQDEMKRSKSVNTQQLYSNKEVMKISQAMDTP